MAKKFFNKRVKSRKKMIVNGIIIGICLIGIILCFYLTQNLGNEDKDKVNIELQNSVTVDLNSEAPDSDVYFLELSGVSESEINVDYSNVDFSKVGEYTVAVTVFDERYYVNLKVKDVTSPELTLAPVTIAVGEDYDYTKFVSSCTDNSKKDCSLAFYSGSVDQNNVPIDYSIYTKEGTYDIMIIASDDSGNTSYKTTTLIIGNGNNLSTDGAACNYGGGAYSNSYIIAYSVVNNGCALGLDLYQNSSVREPIEKIANTETEKVKTEVDKISGLTLNISISRSITAIINETANGFVGYSLYIEVKDDNGDIIVSYYLNEDGTRVYYENPYNLK